MMQKKDKEYVTLVPEFERKKLLNYADTFRELAKTYAGRTKDAVDLQKEMEKEERLEYLSKRRMIENREILAEHLEEVAQIMTHLAEVSYQKVNLSHKKQKQIIQVLKANGIQVKTICLIEQMNHLMEVSIQMSSCRNKHFETMDVAGILSVILNKRLVPSRNSMLSLTEETEIYLFEEEARYDIFSGMAKAIKEGESISGDNYSLMNMGDGKYMCAISDGMGSGEKAYEDSALLIDLLEKLLEAGFDDKMAIQMINGILIAYHEKQNMSTLDLCKINMRDGLGTIFKAGGCDSYVKRENSVEIIKGNSLPMGIFHEMELTETKIQLRAGDYLIMITDGILDGLLREDASIVLQHFIQENCLQNPREIANHILQYVIRTSKGHIKDDMTVCVLGLFDNEKGKC